MAPDPLKLATLPLRLTLRVAGAVLEPASEIVRGTLGLVRGALGSDGDGHDESAADPRSDAAPVEVEVRREAPAPLDPREPGTAPDADPPSAYAPPPLDPEPVAEEPEHVDTGAVLVAESADREIADGIHTDLRVQEPWDGYAGQTAADVIARLEGASAAQIAVVQLYESTHRSRKTVLEAAQRRLAGA